MAFKTINTTLFAIVFIFNATVCFCQDNKALIIATDEFPPYSFYKDGKLTGIAANLVKALMDMAGDSGKISVLPWKRAINYSQTQKMMLFPFARVPYLEKNYKWIGPVMIDSFAFAVRSSEKRAFKTIDDFRDIQVGVNRMTPTSFRLKEFGFNNIQEVTSEKLNAKKLVDGNRIDAWYSLYLILKYTMRLEGIDEKLIRIANTDMNVEMYIGASLTVPDEIVAQWQNNLDEMKENGRYQDILYDSILEWENI